MQASLNLSDTLKSASDALAKITPAVWLGGSTSADPADGPTQSPMKRLKLDVAPSNCTNDTELEITDEAGKSGSSSQDDLLSEIERDFAQDDKEGPNVDTKLAIIVNMRWSSKLTDSKVIKKNGVDFATRELSTSPSSKVFVCSPETLKPTSQV